jgi:Fe-S-cluster containining protein
MALRSNDLHLVQIRDRQLVEKMDTALAQAAHRAGPWLACRPGCTQCCHGAFAINALDALRLRAGMQTLRAADPAVAEVIEDRARSWLDTLGHDFPGDRDSGLLGTSDVDQNRFDDFANDAPCPALNLATGLCDVYAWRPMTCRVFGPPTRPAEDEALACCELCFNGATESEIASCEMPVPHQLEAELVAQCGQFGETIVAFAIAH